MQLACPACHTAFRIDAPTLGEGRTVRCARCRTAWFARPDDLMPEPEMAEAAAEFEATSEDEAGQSAPANFVPKVVEWDDTVMVDVKDSPPLAPTAADRAAPDAAPAALHHWTVSRRRAANKQATMQARLVAVAVILGAIVVAGITSRTNIVRMVPDLAGLYAAAGLPVNLRGLEFKDVRTQHEMHDGIPVLIIEGEIVNIARQTVEVPRLRLAVADANGQEVYSWTTLLPHSVLPAGETLPFRSRLASPPAEGKEVVVRFLNRMDLTAN